MIRRAVAEALGTALLLAIVVGSGIMGELLATGNAAVALLANSVATGAGLFVLIMMLAPISGAHFNPAVTLTAVADRNMTASEAAAYIAAQVAGAIAGVIAAHAMFGQPLLQSSVHVRSTIGECLGEVIATFGLLLAIGLGTRTLATTAAVVALWITSAYWFTSSTSFANPAVTLARSLTDTFAGIAPGDVIAFIVSQLIGATAAFPVVRWLRQHSAAPR